MNQLNPLHIGALLFVLLIFSFFKLNEAKVQLKDIKSSYKESENLAKELKSLKSLYANSEKSKKVLKRILNNRTLKDVKLDVKELRNSTKISAKSLDKKALNFLVGKILNSSYNITKLKINKIDKTTSSLDMEIKW